MRIANPPPWVYMFKGSSSLGDLGEANPTTSSATTQAEWGDSSRREWGDGTPQEWE